MAEMDFPDISAQVLRSSVFYSAFLPQFAAVVAKSGRITKDIGCGAV